VMIPAKVTQVNGDWLWVGNAWVRSGEVVKEADGTTYYNRVVREDSSNLNALLFRGIAFRLKRDYANALKDFNEVIRRDPRSASPYSERASTFYQLQQFDKAVADLTEAIHLAPDVAVFYSDRGCSLRGLESYAKSEADFDEAIRLDPKMALAYSNRGVNWMIQKEYDKAMADFDKAIAIDPKMVYAYDGRGYVWSKRGHYAQALRDWNESTRIAPDEPGGYHNKARLYASCMSLGHRDGKMALANAKKACELDHYEEWRYVATLAAAYAELGQFDKAVEWQKKAIAMNKQPEEIDLAEHAARLKLYEAGMPFRDPEIPEQAEEAGQ
jgi:tetratricopeptide (TPR) repeat protein